jgi:ribonuclease J
VVCSPQVIQILPELAYRADRCEVSFVLSKSEPFNEEALMSFDRLLSWLGLYGCVKYSKIHVSGHAKPSDIRAIIEAANPEIVIPIHTKFPELFVNMHDRVQLAEKGEAIMVP